MSVPLGLSIMRFGAVGIAATATHVILALAAHGLFGATPALANLAGFGGAFAVSYMGNRGWTFESRAPHRQTLGRFLAVSLFGLALTQSIVHVMTGHFGLPFAVSMAGVVCVVPVANFVAARAWAFAPAAGTAGREA